MKVKQKLSSSATLTSVVFSLLSLKCWSAQVENPPEQPAQSASAIEFNSGFIHGSGIDVSRYSKGNPIAPGVYSVLISINGEKRGRYDVTFNDAGTSENAPAMFTLEELQRIGIKLEEETIKQLGLNETNKEKSYTIQELIKNSKVYYNQGDFELGITVPQANLIQFPRGYTDPSRWDAGETAGYIDYNANIYGVSNGDAKKEGGDRESYTSNLNMLAGFNLMNWRLRKRTNMSWIKNDGGARTDNLYTYAATDVTPLKSQLVLGDSNTNGEIFDSFNLRGAQLGSDDRMLPEGLRNYSPIIRGMAESNAKVTIRQHGQKIYETVVPPGEFELNDIGAMGYGGDLEMTITESDGRQKFSTIPFSAPPLLLHKGVLRFNAAVGELRDDTLRDLPKILQTTLRYGLLNNLTIYSGLQLAEKYQACVIGNAVNTRIGGFSIDLIRSRSDLGDKGTKWGNSFRAAYSKYLDQTNTNMTLAAYRYSSEGYYSFRDASIERYGHHDGDYLGADFRAKQRFSLTLSQELWENSSLNLTGSYYNYWDDRRNAKQYAITYNQSLRYFSYSLSALRNSDEDGNYENTILVSINVPFGRQSVERPIFDTLYTSYSNSNKGNEQFYTNVTGSRGEQNEVNYGMGTSFTYMDNEGSRDAFTGYMNYRSPVGQYGLTGSVDNHTSRQLSLQANGSVVAHKGGLTLGPQIGEYPFAIIGAEGAQGASIINGNGAKIDSNGYAIMPSLTPYRENQVDVNTKGLPDTVDILENEKVVVPRMGAAIGIDMKTMVGEPIVLIVRDQGKNFLPIGTSIYDDKNNNQSIIGQGGMAFIRGWDPQAKSIYAMIGKSRCRIVPDNINKVATGTVTGSIMQLEASCIL
ncbi:fimbrial biogenesis outer membrane usher protein [Atlantibacter hermannii]|uniref:fimbria/pilus outer membrane usher protein n=1 Tax=Atlantibacter hermannii TaxID=565 RepID=UPI001C7037DA|nr:fimbria/pilus outer membrane usher protein [Atlantibacter hermannii]MBW9429300.1 fimbrial biogenesis outer membrane usher protein [Atlantibacter hermannii]